MCVSVCMCVVCVCACACVRVRVCVRARVHVQVKTNSHIWHVGVYIGFRPEVRGPAVVHFQHRFLLRTCRTLWHTNMHDYRLVKTHRMPYYMSFSAKEPYN